MDKTRKLHKIYEKADMDGLTEKEYKELKRLCKLKE